MLKDRKKGQRSTFGCAPAPVEPAEQILLVEFLRSSGAIWRIGSILVAPPSGQVTN